MKTMTGGRPWAPERARAENPEMNLAFSRLRALVRFLAEIEKKGEFFLDRRDILCKDSLERLQEKRKTPERTSRNED